MVADPPGCADGACERRGARASCPRVRVLRPTPVLSQARSTIRAGRRWRRVPGGGPALLAVVAFPVAAAAGVAGVCNCRDRAVFERESNPRQAISWMAALTGLSYRTARAGFEPATSPAKWGLYRAELPRNRPWLAAAACTKPTPGVGSGTGGVEAPARGLHQRCGQRRYSERRARFCFSGLFCLLTY